MSTQTNLTVGALFRAAATGDAETARRLVLDGAPTMRFEEGRVASADQVALEAGHITVAEAIRRARAERDEQAATLRRSELEARCTPVASLVELVQHTTEQGEEILVGVGMPSPDATVVQRIFLWTGDGQRVDLLHEAWVRTECVASLMTALSTRNRVFEGACDARPGDLPAICWAAEGPRLRCWVEGRLRLAIDERRILVVRGHRHLHTRRALRSVAVSLSPGWERHGVELCFGQRRREVAFRRQLSATIDPTYDRWSLWSDTEWAVSLARAISSAAGVQMTVPADLR